MTHLETIRAGLAIVRDALSSMEEEVLRRKYGDAWWKTAVLLPLERDGKLPYGWPDAGNAGDLDLQTALKLVSVYHWELFADTFDWKGRERSLLQVMIAIRNNYEGHVTPNREKELTASVTDELLEGMARFLRMFDKKAARRLDAIEVTRDEEMQQPPAAAPRPAAPAPKAAPVREVREAAPAQDPDEVEYRDTPLTEEEREILEASGYKSLWDEEDEEPITFYSRKPTPPPPPPPKPKTVLYRGVRVEEARPVDDGPRYSALNLQDLRRREERRSADRAAASAPKTPPPQAKPKPQAEPEPVEEELPDLEPIARAEKRRVPERARRTGSARKTRWEQDMASVDADTRAAIRAGIKAEETPPPKPQRTPRPALFSGKQKLILILLALAGIALGVGLLFLDGWLAKLWFG